jgi:hypothetical protein
MSVRCLAIFALLIQSFTLLAEEYFVVFLVNARHLDYSDGSKLLKTVAKHPSDWSKNGDVGHAWIYLEGTDDKGLFVLEGGHSGELGILQPKYFEGVMNHIEKGDEPNPVKYLWETQKDGFFQKGSSYHKPTFAAKVDLTKEQFYRIRRYIQFYDYSNYAITGNQCASFVAQIAEIAGLSLQSTVTIPIKPTVKFKGETYPLWSDPIYNEITISSPDILEISLKQAVKEGKAQSALKWYNKELRTPRTQGP